VFYFVVECRIILKLLAHICPSFPMSNGRLIILGTAGLVVDIGKVHTWYVILHNRGWGKETLPCNVYVILI
jgi:hypothetical protein